MKNFEFNFKTLAMAAASAAVVACSDYSPEEYEGNLTQEEYKTIVEYTKNFEDRYGKIDPDQDWGFEALAVKDETRSTRAWIFANSNIGNGNSGWVNVIKGNGGVVYGYENYKIYKNGTSSEIVVPGFPSKTDGLYYVGSANTACASPYTQEQINAGAVKEGSGNIVGDVTNDEIVFVSRWFREHQNPENMSASELLANADSKVTLIKAEYAGCQDLKLNTFFVQHISGDEDRTEVNGSWKSSSPGYGMDQLMAKSNVTDSWGWTPDGLHINNFNSGSSVNKIDQNNPNSYDNVYNSRGIQLYVGNENETVYDFRYHNSQDGQYYNRYAIMHLVFKIGELTYDGYYLGFDYEKHSNGEWSADGYYNNWIVKISDALPKDTPDPEPDNTTARVFCEDLGNTYDFDFNDLVFDIYYTKASEGNYTAHISVQAVGGTLPIYIGTDPNYELHKMMGYTDMKPINVGAAGGHDGVGAYEFTISGCATTNPDDITICVQRNDNSATPTILPKTSSTKSLAPQKICIKNGTGVKWTKESQQIEWGYPDFSKWVEGAGDFGSGKKGFWEGEIKGDYLYR